MAIMITAFAKLMSSTFKGMRTVTQSTELTTEAQLSTPILVDRVLNAACFYDSGTITFGDTILYENTLSPGTTTNVWNVGTDPVLAMFMPESTANPGEYEFFAYYPILRSKYMSTNQIGPSPDVQNDSSVWMILEYKKTMTFGSKPLCDGSELLTGGNRPRYVADYVAPSNDYTSGIYTMFEYNKPIDTDVDQRHSVAINLKFKRKNGNRNEILPTDGSLISTKIFPKNIAYW